MTQESRLDHDQHSVEGGNNDEIGILYKRIPEPGIIVAAYNIDELKTHANVTEAEVTDNQKELGASEALRYKPGIKSKYGWEYSEYMIFDQQNRPIATSQSDGGVTCSHVFEYDSLGRLSSVKDNMGFISYVTKEFVYSSDTPDKDGYFHYTVKETRTSGLRSDSK